MSSAEPISSWSATLASNLARVCAHWHACTAAAAETVEDYARQVAREWRVMVKDPLWAFYGGHDTPDRRRAYVGVRFDEYRRQLTPCLHRPDCLALAEALEERRAAEIAA